MFLTSDASNQKLRAHNKEENTKLWRQWILAKSAITNFNNIAVKKAISRMPGKALPSGSDFSLFLERVALWQVSIRMEGDSDWWVSGQRGRQSQSNAGPRNRE
jgi:hypothetical protein